MAFTFTPLALGEVLRIESDVFADERGFLRETYKASVFQAHGIGPDFVQENHVRSTKGTLRGLHYQLPPHAQGKLVWTLRGRIFDVAVDIRRGSPTFGQWVGEELSAENKRALWIPIGFAHGFMALEDETDVYYKMTGGEYAPESAREITWDDPTINVQWPLDNPALSPKDAAAVPLEQAEIGFTYPQ